MQPLRAQLGRDSAALLCGRCHGCRGLTHTSSQWRWRPRRRTAMIVPVKRRSHVLEGGAGVVWFLELTAKWAVAPAALAAVIAGTAWAQNPPDDRPAPPAPGAARSSPLPAPVGHRQPRASDVPAPPAGDNSRAAEPRDDIDEKLRICRGC
jgi:hypothetical protein